MKKYLGYTLWLLAFAIPFRFALLDTAQVGNIKGLFSFVVMLVLIFVGYALVDGSKKANAGH